MEILGIENLPEFITALTQGELDPSQVEQVRAYLREHPELAGEIDRSAKLAAEARRVMLSDSPAASMSLRNKIAAMDDDSESPMRIRSAPARSPLRAWAWAASVLIAISIGMMAGHAMIKPAPTPVVGTAEVIPATIIARVDRIHAMCARAADNLHNAGYPTDETALVDDMKADLHTDVPHPDLSSYDFKYIGAGPCGDTLPGTVHLLYKSTRPGSMMAVSLFVQTNHGQFKIDANKMYQTGDVPFPMYVWRTDKVVYFLIADNEAIAKKVMGLIGTAPR